MPVGLADMFRLQEQPHVDGRQRRVLEPRRALHVIRTGRPREIVDVFLIVAVQGGPIGVIPALALNTGRADDPSLRHRQPYVVDAVVGEELRRGMKLMAVPAFVLEHTQFREPLHDEEIVPDHAGPCDRPRDVRRPADLDRGRPPGRHGFPQRYRHHRLVIGIAIVGRNEMYRAGEIGRRRRRQLQRRDVDARAIGGGRRVRRRASPELPFSHERGSFVLPRVPVQVKLQIGGRTAGDVAPRDHFGSGNRVRCGVELRGDRVVRVARRERLGRQPGDECGGQEHGQRQLPHKRCRRRCYIN